MILNNYSKCVIKYHDTGDTGDCEELLEKKLNVRFLIEFKCCSPVYSGLVYSVHDLDTDMLYHNYNKKELKRIVKENVNKSEFIDILYNCMYVTNFVEGINKKNY